MVNTDFKLKYLKYKQKYLNLVKQLGGSIKNTTVENYDYKCLMRDVKIIEDNINKTTNILHNDIIQNFVTMINNIKKMAEVINDKQMHNYGYSATINDYNELYNAVSNLKQQYEEKKILIMNAVTLSQYIYKK